AGSIIQQLGPCIGKTEGQTVRKAFLQLGRQRVVTGTADVVPKQGDCRKSSEWPQQLLLGQRRCAQRRGCRNLSKERVGHPLQQLRSEREILVRKLIDVGVGNAQVSIFRPQVSYFNVEILPNRLLHRKVPLLGIAGSLV